MNERKLLPYEHGLIDALGVTKEEYLEFVAVQNEYNDAKVGTALDIRNEVATIALVLTIVGTILQVVAALIAEDPKTTEDRTRDQRFAPRFGFNSSQELAKYGDAVPIVYTNVSDNPDGGVRVAASLLWSAVLSYGSSQFMQLMLAVGASRIRQISPDRTAIGQLALRDVVRSRTWLYYNENGATAYSDYVEGNSSSPRQSADSKDPTRRGRNQQTATLVYREGRRATFSQAYAPSSGASCGITGVVPIYASITRIRPNGKLAPSQLVPIELRNAGLFWTATNNRPLIPEGAVITVDVKSTRSIDKDPINDGVKQALRGAASVFDEGSLYKLGSAIFRVRKLEYQRDGDIDDGSLKVELICEVTGTAPSIDYSITSRNTDSAKDVVEDQISNREFTIESIDKQLALVENLSTSDKRKLKRLEQNEDSILAKQKAIQRNRARINRGDLSNARINALKEDNKRLRKEIDSLEDENANLLRQIEVKDWEKPKELRRRKRELEAEIVELSKNKPELPRDNENQRLGFKALARIEQAVYSSTTKCSAIELALRSKVFRRLSGRASQYGKSGKSYGYDSVENGTQPRTCMFYVEYSLNGGRDILVPYIFCIRSSADQDVFNYLRLLRQSAIGNTGTFQTYSWTVKLTPVLEPRAEKRRDRRIVGYCYIKPNAKPQRVSAGSGASSISVEFSGAIRAFSEFPFYNDSPKDTNEWDLFSLDTRSQTQFSFDAGPEITITAANEQFFDEWRAYSENLSSDKKRLDNLYQGLSILSLHAFSGRGFQDLRNITTWVREGKELRRLSTNPRSYDSDAKIEAFVKSSPNGSSSYAPDIFLDTVLDKENGIGNYARLDALDFQALAIAKAFCVKNKLFMDGVIADSGSWREFWARTASFSLLEMARIGGKETLIPGIPAAANGDILSSTPLPIDSLFNQGNIIEGSFKEEYLDYGASVQDVIITAVYRDVEDEGYFPRNNSLEVKLKEAKENSAIRETVDLSQHVATKRQARLVARFLCLSRSLFRKAFEWQTLPSETFIQPGSYVYLDIGLSEWDNIYTGMIMEGGQLNLPATTLLSNGQYNFLIYRSGQKPFSRANVSVANGTASSLANFEGSLFVIGKPSGRLSKRVVRVTDVSMDEEGLVTIKGTEHPTDNNGVSLLAKRLQDGSQFDEQ
jgi:hypothetical protein